MTSKGFSLIELLMALSITLGIGLIVFQLFQQNERLFRDQNLVIEMQQSARVVASQIADEVRMAGQGVPVYASTFDDASTDAVAVILASSTADRIDFRAGLSLAETNVITALPLDLALDSSYSLTVGNGSLFSSGKFVYIWGPAEVPVWAWVRAEVSAVNGNVLTVTPRQSGRSGDGIRFTGFPTLSLDETVSFYLSGTTVRRATGTAANEIGRNVMSLTFAYYDRDNHAIVPDSMANGQSISRVDVHVVTQTSSELSNGSHPNYSLSLRTIPRNLRVR